MLAVQGLTVNEEPIKNTIYTPSATTTTSATVSGFVQSNVLQSVAQPASGAAPPQMVTINTRLSAPVVTDIKPIATYTVPLPSITGIPELKIRHSTPSISTIGNLNINASIIDF